MVRTVSAIVTEHAPGHVGSELSEHAPEHVGSGPGTRAALGTSHAPGHVEDVRAEGAAAPERFLLQLTIGNATREKLHYAQALLSHAVPSGDLTQVLDRALDALIVGLEKRKLGAGTRLRPKLGSAIPSGCRLRTPPVGERSVVRS